MGSDFTYRTTLQIPRPCGKGLRRSSIPLLSSIRKFAQEELYTVTTGSVREASEYAKVTFDYGRQLLALPHIKKAIKAKQAKLQKKTAWV